MEMNEILMDFGGFSRLDEVLSCLRLGAHYDHRLWRSLFPDRSPQPAVRLGSETQHSRAFSQAAVGRRLTHQAQRPTGFNTRGELALTGSRVIP